MKDSKLVGVEDRKPTTKDKDIERQKQRVPCRTKEAAKGWARSENGWVWLENGWAWREKGWVAEQRCVNRE